MSDYQKRPDHFMSERSTVFFHPRLSHQRIDSQIEYFSSALSDLQSRAGQLAEENQHLHSMLNTAEDGSEETVDKIVESKAECVDDFDQTSVECKNQFAVKRGNKHGNRLFNNTRYLCTVLVRIRICSCIMVFRFPH